MNIRVYAASASYLLIDGHMSPPRCTPPAQLVFSISDDRLPSAVVQMLECALAQNGMLELRESWADHLFHECPGWQNHKHRRTRQLVS
jgi:hypothetical protein